MLPNIIWSLVTGMCIWFNLWPKWYHHLSVVGIQNTHMESSLGQLGDKCVHDMCVCYYLWGVCVCFLSLPPSLSLSLSPISFPCSGCTLVQTESTAYSPGLLVSVGQELCYTMTFLNGRLAVFSMRSYWVNSIVQHSLTRDFDCIHSAPHFVSQL